MAWTHIIIPYIGIGLMRKWLRSVRKVHVAKASRLCCRKPSWFVHKRYAGVREGKLTKAK